MSINKLFLVLALLFALSACSVGKKCNKMCHCPNAEGECTNCECNSREEDKSFENEGGLVIDDTGECESCQ